MSTRASARIALGVVTLRLLRIERMYMSLRGVALDGPCVPCGARQASKARPRLSRAFRLPLLTGNTETFSHLPRCYVVAICSEDPGLGRLLYMVHCDLHMEAL